MQQVERVAVPVGQRLHSREVDAAGERGQRTQQPLLVLVEQLVRRRDAGPERALPRVLGSTPPRGEVEGTVEPLTHCAQGHHGDLPGGELDAERQPVEAAQHLDQVGGIVGPDLEPGGTPSRVLDEGSHSRLPTQRVEVGDLPRYGQRLQPDDVLARHLQGDP